MRAKDPQFTLGISNRSFDVAANFVQALQVYHRHVALSANDTKLLATYRPFYDRESHQWFILGGVGEPLVVGDSKDLQEELERAELRKATKVSISFFLFFPLPSIYRARSGSWLS